MASNLWYLSLNRAEQVNLNKLLPTYSDDLVIRQLHRFIQDQIKQLQVTTKLDYGSPNWGFLQAHRNGQLETLRTIDKMLGDIDDKAIQ